MNSESPQRTTPEHANSARPLRADGRRHLLPRTAGGIAAVVLLLLLPLAAAAPRPDSAAPARAGGNPAVVGKWSPPFDVRTIGTHVALLHTGQVLLFIYPLAGRSSAVSLWNPATGVVTDNRAPTHRDLFCSGHSLLPDGRLLVAGGTLWGHGGFFGSAETDFFEPATRQWTAGPQMAFPRWYPTTLELAGGDLLIVSGEAEGFAPVETLERYETATNTISSLPASASRPIHDYPRMVLLPTGKVFLAGQEASTSLFDPETATWTPVGDMTHGGRFGGNVVLLPGLQKVMALGGNAVDPLPPTAAKTPPTASAEIIDFSQSTPAWRATSPMRFARQHANAVLLPDGTVLVVGGGQRALYKAPVRQAELFDPATETWTTLASQRAPRCYHSTALLLPDGRVLSAGMDSGALERTAEVYSPPYLFRGPRPLITTAPSSLDYGSTFAVVTPDAATAQKVALLRPGSVTHATNFDQRYVGLTFSAGAGELTVRAPNSGAEAPPGWYMLFVIGAGGVPSQAAWVHVG